MDKAVASYAEGCGFDSRPSEAAAICTVQVALKGYCLVRRVALTASQLDLPFLMSLSIARCGRLQLGVATWATSVALLQVVDN